MKTAAFDTFLRFLAGALATGSDLEKLAALALACKVGNSVKTVKPRIAALINGLALAEFPPLRRLSDSDERYYAANVWRYSNAAWISEFLIQCIVEEESAEKARRECTDGLVCLSAGVEELLKTLGTRIRFVMFDTESPGDSMGRRVRRIVAALRGSVANSRQPAGESVGSNLRIFLRTAFERTGPPKDISAKVELAREVFTLILHIVRSRYSLALSSETFSPIVTVKDWFSDAEWRNLSEDSVLQEFAESIQAAIELLARTGVVDNGLFGHLVLASGNVDMARKLTAQIVVRNAGLAPDIVAWLKGQQAKKSTALSSESQMVRIEETIADLILSALSTSEAANAVRTELVPELSLFNSLPHSILDDLLIEFERLMTSVQLLSETRRLKVFGSLNAIEDFSPLQHDFADQTQAGARLVRVVRFGIMTNFEDGTSRIVRKALVEPA